MKFKWTIQVEVDETWVADGFNLTDDSARLSCQRITIRIRPRVFSQSN